MGSDRIDPRAYEAYRKGRFYWNQRTPDSLQQPLQQFQQSLVILKTRPASRFCFMGKFAVS